MGNPSNLGAAQGSISIDISQLQAAQVAVRNAASQINQAMASVSPTMQRAQASSVGLAGGLRQLAGAFGLTLGAAGVAQFARAAVASAQLATAYDRQYLAATQLAGGQTQLNELLDTYIAASGDIATNQQALAETTNLIALGFANSTEQLNEYVRAVRGASIATGRSQEFISQFLQLELLNQSGKRLNEIGLSMGEVRDRAEELRASNAGLTKEMAYQQALMQRLSEKFGGLTEDVVAQKVGVENLAQAWDNFRLAVAEANKEDINQSAGLIGNILNATTQAIQQAEQAEVERRNAINRLLGRPVEITPSQQAFINSSGERQQARRGRGGSDASSPRFDAEQTAVIVERQQAINDIERNANRDRIEATRQYEQQRTDTIRQYEQGIARDAADFALSRARQEEDFARSVATLRRDIGQREARAAEDLATNLARLRIDNRERIIKIEEDFNRTREKAARDHSERLIDAAGRLDALAVSKEQRRFADEEKDRNESHDAQLKDAKSALEKAQQQANDAAQLQLRRAREDDEQRLSDMVADLQLRRDREDEDRAIRLQRAAEDHQAQLDEQARNHQDRLQQIDAHAAEELTRTQEAYDERLVALGVHNDAVKERQDKFEQDSLISYGNYLDTLQAQFAARTQLDPAGLPYNNAPFAGIGTPQPSTITNVPRVSINIYPTPGQSSYDIGAEVRRQFEQLLRDLQ